MRRGGRPPLDSRGHRIEAMFIQEKTVIRILLLQLGE